MTDDYGKLSIDTPEQVALEYGLAGIGSRFMAVMIDHLLQGAVILLAALVGTALGTVIGPLWSIALLVLFAFLVEWGYFTLFEALRDGQTPGKKMVHIRVIKSNGRAITVFEAMTRNLVRLVDYLPVGYLVGMITMFVDSKNRRLGDLAADTLVVHEPEPQAVEFKLSNTRQELIPANSGSPFDVRKLTAGDLELIETFLSRRYDIEAYARHVTAERLADMMRAKLAIDRSVEPNDETLLEILAKTLRDTASFNVR